MSLEYWYLFPVSIGIALITELFGFSSGLIAYVRAQLVDYRLGANLLMFSIPGAILGVLGADLFPAIVLKTIFAVGHVYGFIEDGGGDALQETVNVAMFTVPGVLIGGQLGPRAQAHVNPDKMKVLISWIFMAVGAFMLSTLLGA
jgi:hypothetical protein